MNEDAKTVIKSKVSNHRYLEEKSLHLELGYDEEIEEEDEEYYYEYYSEESSREYGRSQVPNSELYSMNTEPQPLDHTLPEYKRVVLRRRPRKS